MSKKIIDKIRKLLALSTSPNENEAALAAAKAKELLDQYELTEVDLVKQEIEEKKFDTGTIAVPQWRKSLASNVANSYGCGWYYSSGCKLYHEPNINGKITFYGPELDVEVAIYICEFCITTVERMTKAYMESTKIKLHGNNSSYTGGRVRERNSYQLGLARSLGKKIYNFSKANRVKNENIKNYAGITGKELVVIKRDAVMDFRKSLSLRSGGGSSQSVCSEGYGQGQSDGNSVNIRSAVNGQTKGYIS